MEKLTKEMHAFLSPGSSLPAPLNINKGQEIHDRSKTAHRKPPVKCFLTNCEIFCSISMKITIDNLIGMALNL